MKRRRPKKFLRKKTLIVAAIVAITMFNIYKATSHQTVPEMTAAIPFLPQSGSTINNSRQHVSLITSNPLSIRINVTHYKLVDNTRYHYEFHFEYNSDTINDDPRLMILLNGHGRTCADYWEFAVGRRILATLRAFRFLILAICSPAKTFDPDGPVQNNAAVKWIYISLQRWMNDVYYKQFQRYPRLYIHGVSRGSKVAALLCRVLPIREQVFTIYPGHPQGLLVRSDYSTDLQKRLQFDQAYANWFYFNFCYNSTDNTNISQICPFQSERHHYQPVPPTYFIYLQNDQLFDASAYTSLIAQMRQDALALGGKLLNDTEGVKFDLVSPSNITPTYMQQTFDTWHSKPYASAFFYEHYVNQSIYNPYNHTRQTCQCLPIDFRYYQLYLNITQTWSKQQQDEYNDYTNDIEEYLPSFCEDICGDLAAYHAMSSRHLDKALQWINRMDSLRHSLSVADI